MIALLTWLKPVFLMALNQMWPNTRRRRVRGLLGVVLGFGLMLIGASPGLTLTVDDIPNPRVNQGWVSDTADQLSAPTERRLNGLLDFLEGETGVEMAIVTIPASPPDQTPKAFATELFNTWGIGKADTNNGVLLLLSMGDRRIEIETGRGLEQSLPSDRLAALIRDTLRPALQVDDVDGAVWAGTAALVVDLTGVEPNAPLASAAVRSLYTSFLIVGTLCAVGGLAWIIMWRGQPIPLPPTGSFTYNKDYTFVELATLSVERMVNMTSHRPHLPRLPLILTAVGVSLSAAALSFWMLVRWIIPYDTRSGILILGTTAIASSISLLTLLGLDTLFASRPRAGQPDKTNESPGRVDASPLKWRERLLQGLLYGGIWIWVASLIAGALIMAIALMEWVWGLFMPITPPLQVSVITPLLVGLCNAGIMAYVVLGRDRQYRPIPAYCCQICRSPITTLSLSDGLRELLHPYTVARAWRCETCHPALSLDGLFLVTQVSRPRSYSAGSQSYSSAADTTAAGDRPSSTYDSSYGSSWDTSTSSGGSDFGGGSSDGGGAGDNW